MPPRKEWTDEEVQAEISAAVKIVSEDRERAQYAALHERFGKAPEGTPEPEGAPPKKEGGDPPEPTSKKRDLWWGEAINEE